jgi:outer membrane protein assembly factor BamB
VSEQIAPVEGGGPAIAPPPLSVDRVQPRSASDAALARYRIRMRRQRTVYYSIIAVVLVAIGITVGVAWSRGEVAHTTLHTVASPPHTLPLAAAAATQQVAWRSADRIGVGDPRWAGTVVTYSAHTVAGRDARTGQRTWYYTRTDRLVCTAAQLNGTTVAIYQLHGNCDELSAFDTDTGRRRWTRTLDIDGLPLNGQPSYQVASDVLLIASHRVVYAIDPLTGYNRWTYQRNGCRIGSVALGSSGALISQNCSPHVDCTNLKFCGPGPQLFLRDKYAGREDSKPNADQMKWNRFGDTTVPVSADDVISSVDRDGTSLHVFTGDHGKPTQTLQLSPVRSSVGPITAQPTDTAEIIWVGGTVYAITGDSSVPRWQRPALSAPTVIASGDEVPPALSSARITASTSAGVESIEGESGKVGQTFDLALPGPRSVVYPSGTGFLVGSASGVVSYQ